MSLLIIMLVGNGLWSWDKLRLVLLSYLDPLPHVSQDIFK